MMTRTELITHRICDKWGIGGESKLERQHRVLGWALRVVVALEIGFVTIPFIMP